MREIKFRGKCKWENHPRYGEWIIAPDQIDISKFWKLVEQQDGIDPSTVGQFTGLKDSKGVDAFEGDIVYAPINKTKYEIRFGLYDNECDDSGEPDKINGFFLWAVDGFCESSANIDKYGIEIIGSIHDKENNNDQS